MTVNHGAAERTPGCEGKPSSTDVEAMGPNTRPDDADLNESQRGKGKPHRQEHEAEIRSHDEPIMSAKCLEVHPSKNVSSPRQV